MGTKRIRKGRWGRAAFGGALLWASGCWTPIQAAVPSVSATLTLQATGAADQDDMAIWVHPTTPDQSLIIGSDKKANKIFVYGLDGKTLQSLASVHPGNIDVRYNFPLGSGLVDIVAWNERDSSKIIVYKVNAATRQLIRVDTGNIRTGSNYGFCLYRSPSTWKFYGFATGKGSKATGQYELRDNGSGQVTGSLVRSFTLGSITEACVGDDALGPPDNVGHVYFARELGQIHRFNGEPNGGTTGTIIADTTAGIVPDAEGLTIYHTGTGGGYLILSSQGESHFDVYDRLPPHAHVFEFTVGGASGTDGIDVTNVNLGPSFPQGLFLAHNGHKAIKVVPWQAVANAGGLTIDPSWDPRQ